MIRSSLVKSACVAIALLGFSAPQAGAIELQGSNPSTSFSEGLISKAFVAHRGVTRDRSVRMRPNGHNIGRASVNTVSAPTATWRPMTLGAALRWTSSMPLLH